VVGCVLVVDDEDNIRELLRLYLVKEGFTVALAADGDEALQAFDAGRFDLVILDIMLPGADGWQVCRRIREASRVPIIMLSAKGERYDRILGLELGADDYIVKPFDPYELLARVRAVLRRCPPAGMAPGAGATAATPVGVAASAAATATNRVLCGKLIVDRDEYRATLGGRELDLTPRELELLYHLASHPNRTFSRDQLLESVWGYDYAGETRTVDAHVKRLRQKLGGGGAGAGGDGWGIATVWGIGYRFEAKRDAGLPGA
jgi:DNA-binding response OmpR family regulator